MWKLSLFLLIVVVVPFSLGSGRRQDYQRKEYHGFRVTPINESQVRALSANRISNSHQNQQFYYQGGPIQQGTATKILIPYNLNTQFYQSMGVSGLTPDVTYSRVKMNFYLENGEINFLSQAAGPKTTTQTPMTTAKTCVPKGGMCIYDEGRIEAEDESCCSGECITIAELDNNYCT